MSGEEEKSDGEKTINTTFFLKKSQIIITIIIDIFVGGGRVEKGETTIKNIILY